MAFVWPVRVYWEDTDAGGVVYYANYLKFLERARTEWLRSLGYGQETLRERHGLLFVIRRVEIDYLAPARLDDALDVHVDSPRLGRASLEVSQRIVRDALVLATARVRVACVDAVHFKPARIPPPLLAVAQPSS